MENIASTPLIPNPTLRNKFEKTSRQNVALCHQCKKCTSGCPVTFAMDILPHQVVHLLNLGQIDKLLESKTIWTCASCETCSTRCPNGIDISHIMDTLRQLSIKNSAVKQHASAPLFHDEFLKSVRQSGRVNEFKTIGIYTLKNQGVTGLLKQARTGIKMLLTGKLKLINHPVKNTTEIREIFERSKERVK